MSQNSPLKYLTINVKLFISFWLIIIVSISFTQFISNQLAKSEGSRPLFKEDKFQLEFLAKQLAKTPPEKLERSVQKQSRKLGKVVILKNLNSGEILGHRHPKFRPMINFARKHNFDTISTIKAPFGHISGPLKIINGDQEYQLLLGRKISRREMGSYIHHIPGWLRVGVTLLISGFICWLLARSFSRPISKIQKAASKLGDGDLSYRIHDVKSSGEIGKLANSFNAMAEKLEKSLSAQNRLIADVSHELRTPMTRLQMALGLAQQNKDDEEALTKYLVKCESEIDKLDNMVGDVLSLSRLENSLYQLNCEPISINELMKQIVQDLNFLADQKQIHVNQSIEEEYVVDIDVSLISSALTNVLTNAIKYSPENSEIKIKISKDNEYITIAISDQGHGVPPEALGKMFEPFYRVADDRNRKTGGTGIGLAIAKQAISAHQGYISAANDNTGLTVTITLPAPISKEGN